MLVGQAAQLAYLLSRRVGDHSVGVEVALVVVTTVGDRLAVLLSQF